MQAERHEGDGLKYITILPDGYEPGIRYPLVIMLHGFGANMQDLAGLAPTINQRGYVYAFPNAPLPFALGGGYTGWGWTPRGADATAENSTTAASAFQIASGSSRLRANTSGASTNEFFAQCAGRAVAMIAPNCMAVILRDPARPSARARP